MSPPQCPVAPHKRPLSTLRGALTVLLAAVGCGGSSGLPAGYQGIVEFDEQVVAAEVPGRVREVLVARGTVVRDQQELIRLDDTLAELALQARSQAEASAQAQLDLLKAGARSEDIDGTEASVRGAKAQLAYARNAAEQARTLGQTGSVSRSAVDLANTELAAATAEHRALEQKLAAMRGGSRVEEIAAAKAHVASLALETSLEREKVQRHTLRANGEGMVIDVSVESGELAAVGTPALTIADVTHPYADVFVPEGELAGIRIGTKASLKVDGLDTSMPGRVEFISPKAEFTPRFLFSEQERPHLVFRVRIRVADPKANLHAGLPAFVQLSR